MSYQHFGRLGDIWKHLPLGAFLSCERPRRYIETNSAYPAYELSHSPAQLYGVYLVAQNLQRSAAIAQSDWWQTLQGLAENVVEPKRYLGSPALALRLLRDHTAEFLFFDLEQAALVQIQNYAQKLNLSAKVTCRNEDSINALLKLTETMSAADLVHIDPYEIHQPNAAGDTYYQGFRQAAAAGAVAILWYGFNTPTERDAIHNGFQRQPSAAGISAVGIEVIAAPFGPDPAPVIPGVLGCGLLTANLSAASQAVFRNYAAELLKIYQGSKVPGGRPGDLACHEFQVGI